MGPSFNKLARAMLISCNGLKCVWQGEFAFRLEVYISICLLPVIFILSISPLLKLMLILLLMLLLMSEILNSAIETVVDRISLEQHEQSKVAKDMGSAAVFMVILMNVVAWVYVLI